MSLMKTFEHVDMQLNECEYEVSVTSAKFKKQDDQQYFERLESEKKKEDGKLREDGEKRMEPVREHSKASLEQLGRIIEDLGERSRKAKALEEARRRNGEV